MPALTPRRRARAPQPGRRTGQRPVPRPRPRTSTTCSSAPRAGPPLPVVRAGRADRRAARRTAVPHAADQPHDGRRRRRGARTAPTSPTCEPDYGRDEAFQKAYAAAAGDPEAWAAFASGSSSGDEADYQEAVAPGQRRARMTRARPRSAWSPCAEAFRGDGEILGRADGHHPDARRPAGPADLRARPAAHRRRGLLPRRRRCPSAAPTTSIEGWMPFRSVFDDRCGAAAAT